MDTELYYLRGVIKDREEKIISFSLQTLSVNMEMWEILVKNLEFPNLSSLTLQNKEPLPCEEFQQIWKVCPRIRNLNFLQFPCEMKGVAEFLEFSLKQKPLVIQWISMSFPWSILHGHLEECGVQLDTSKGFSGRICF